VHRLSERLPLGAVPVGIGLLHNGVTAYLFVVIASRALGPTAYEPVGMLWAATFLLGPGLFFPLEQETARLVAGHDEIESGTLSVVRRVALVGICFGTIFLLSALLASDWIIDELFDGESVLFIAMVLVVVGLGAGHLARGLLAGKRRFVAYARHLIGEGSSRVLMLLVVVLVGAETAGPYGIILMLAPPLAILISLGPESCLFTKGPEIPWPPLIRAIGSLVAASLSTAILLNVSPLAVKILSDDTTENVAGIFLNALLVARIPLFFFQAIQASLLPRLAFLVSDRDFVGLWQELRRMLVLVTVVGGIAVVGFSFSGPFLVKVAFGSDFLVSATDMALLATSSVGLMLALTFSQGLIACESHGRMAVAWIVGVLIFPLATSIQKDLFLRVELALITSVFVVVVLMGLLLQRCLSREGVEIFRQRNA